MRKVFALLITICTLTSLSYAQDDSKMCGTWTGNFKAWTERYHEEADNKIVVRIRKTDDTYTVRVKEVDIRSGEVFYWRPCTVTSSTESAISFYIAEPMKWDEQDHCYYTYTSYYTLTYSKGVLYYNQDSYTIHEYDNNKRSIGTMKEPGKDCYNNIPMYNDDEDW